MDYRIADVAAVVRDAFGNTSHPAEDQITKHGLIPIDSDDREIWLAFANKRWQDVGFDTCKRYAHATSFLMDGALLYYLPAIMLASLQEFETDDLELQSRCIWMFYEPDQYGRGRITGLRQFLTEDQIVAIGGYIQLLQQMNTLSVNDQQALNHWHQNL